jgi:hypothetical protein
MIEHIPIKENGFIFFTRFQRDGADPGRLRQLLTHYREPIRKRRSMIRQYGLSSAGTLQSGRNRNKPS